MRYNDCTNNKGCHSCSLVSYGKDCRNNPVHPLAYQRKLNKLSQSQLAKLSGVSVRAIQDYEQGKNDINKSAGETLYKLATACGCAMEDLLIIVAE